ncbi:MAG: type II secretion system secretin GspD [Candidatus Hydrogenedentes bacterium]|nr:type II secretion system secretin GspD [Candidatus Hydrogenedentota bacterium]
MRNTFLFHCVAAMVLSWGLHGAWAGAQEYVEPAPAGEPTQIEAPPDGGTQAAPAAPPPPAVVEEAPVEEAPPEEVPLEEEYIEEEPEPPAPQPQPIRPKVMPTRPRPSIPARPTRPIRPGMPTPGLPPSGKPFEPVPNEEKTGETPTAPISFDFQETPLYNVIESISKLTGRNFDVDPNVGSINVTVITHDKIPPEMAYEVLESILATRGYSMVETLDGNLIKIIPTPDATSSEKLPLVDGAKPIDPEEYDSYSTHIIQVQHSNAEEIANALKILGSKNARIDTYAPSNTLIITDTADGLRRMFSFLEAADVPGFETAMEIFTLEYTRAEALAEQLNSVLLEGEGQVPGQQQARPVPTRPVRPVRTPTVPGQQTNQVIGTREEVLRMVPDERLNALIVVASEGMMERVRDLVRRLDTPTSPDQNTLHIYELRNADAEQVEAALQPLLGTAPRAAAAGGGGGGAAGGGGGAGAAAINPEVQPFERKVQVVRYDQTNALLIVAAPQDYQVLESFIARLDVPQRQVYVDAVVMDVTVSNDYGLTVDAAAITGNDGFGMTNTGNISGLVDVAQAAEEIVGGPQAALAASVLGLGSEGGITAGVYDDITVEIGGSKVKIPFVPLLFQAIEKISDVEVLSQPSLTVVDNEEASFVVGQEVPFISSTSRGLAGSGQNDGNLNSNFGYTRVEREDVGVKLKTVPQISEGDNVLLEIEIEVSDTNATQIGTDNVLLEIEIEVSDTNATQIGTVDILGPTINKSLVTNKILVKDGSTAVIAGLIRDTATRKNTQPPILGDVPGLGWLFKSKSNRREKRNMVVLVTPHIVKENVDLERVTQYKLEEYHDSNMEEMLEVGFFKKIQRKKEMRRDYRPTFDRTEALTGRRVDDEQDFSRGDLKR